MRTLSTAGSMALVALLVGIMPAPASAQLGGFLKKQLKQKVVHTIVDSAVSKVAGQASKPGDASNASNASNVNLPAGLDAQLEKNMVDITPQALDKLEKFLTVQREQGKRGAAQAADALAKTDGLTLVQYGMLTQRVLFFCATAASPDSGGTAMRALAASSGMLKAYKPAEALALKPRCARLTSLLGS